MDIGKLSTEDLNKLINCNNVRRSDVRIKSKIGEDCSVVNFGEYECVLSTDPITASDHNIGKLAVNVNVNDIASCGVEPVGILVTILAPQSASIDDLKCIMNDISSETSKYNMEILGGHTEVTDSVNRIIVSCTVIGKCVKGKAVSTSCAKAGDDIIVTGHIGYEGTSILAHDYEEKIKSILTEKEIEEAKKYSNDISVLNAGLICGKFGVSAMHDITEGGLLGALYEMADASGVGFKIYKNKIPVSKVTRKLCKGLGIDELRFISSGSMLISTKRGDILKNILSENNIFSEIIGKITESGKILEDNGSKIEVEPPHSDELYKAKR